MPAAVLIASLFAASDGRQRTSDSGARTGVTPNIVLIIVDTLRADAVGSYGGDPAVTPHIDRVARDGARFPAASVAPWTMPAVSSLLTSTYPSEHGHGSRRKIREDVRSLPEILRSAGYATAAFLDIHLPVEIARGFATHECLTCDKGTAPRRLVENLASLPFGRARDWIERHANQPFFVLIHTYEVHDYVFVKPYQRAVAEVKYPGYEGPIRRWRPELTHETIDRIFTDQLEDASSADYLKALYMAGVAAVDAEIGSFDNALRALKLWSDTVVVLTSDHGEGFDSERRRLHHGGRLHEDLLSVPLVVRWPARIAPAVPSQRTSLLDVMPTLLQFADVQPPPGMRGLALFPGGRWRTLARLFGLTLKPARVPDRDLMAEESVFFVRPDGHREIRDTHQFALYSNEAKLIHSPDRSELYELDTDPGETLDLIELRPQLAASMRGLLQRKVEALGAPAQSSQKSVLGVLRSLGYVR